MNPTEQTRSRRRSKAPGAPPARTGPGDPHQGPIQTETGEPGPPVIDLDKAVPVAEAREEEIRATTEGGHGAVDDPDDR